MTHHTLYTQQIQYSSFNVHSPTPTDSSYKIQISKYSLINIVITFQIHERFFAIKHHQQIDISVFYSQTERYKPKLCASHDEKELVTACYYCREMFCESCTPKSSQCSESKSKYGRGTISQEHRFRSAYLPSFSKKT